MVIDLLGDSLEGLFCYCSRKFSIKTVLMIAEQCIERVEFLHSKHFLHRDIKPDNFLTGFRKESNVVYIIDFGLSKRYRDPKTKMHIPCRDNKKLTGTARYASINTHMGIEQSRRDDFECLGYMLLYFLRGSLPWQGVKGITQKEKQDRIMEKKMSFPVESLCKGFPSEFTTFVNYSKNLQFESKPDYNYLKKLFKNALHRYFYYEDRRFDWEIIKNGEVDSEGNIKLIAEERKTLISIPLAFFIQNEKHYIKYKTKKSKDVSATKSDNKSQMSDSTTPRSQLDKVVTLNATAKRNIMKYFTFLKG